MLLTCSLIPLTSGRQQVAARMWYRIGRTMSSCSLLSICQTSCRRFCWSVSIDCRSISLSTSGVQYYVCASNRNYTHYCNPELDKLIDRQSMETDQQKRRQLVWQIDSKLQEDIVRPILYHMRAATCWRPEVKGIKLQVNSIYNNWRMEEVWLDR